MEPLVLFRVQLRVSPVCYSTSDAVVSFLKGKKNRFSKSPEVHGQPHCFSIIITAMANSSNVLFFHLNQEFIPDHWQPYIFVNVMSMHREPSSWLSVTVDEMCEFGVMNSISILQKVQSVYDQVGYLCRIKVTTLVKSFYCVQ